jgi:hypothetical protein
MLEGSYNKVIEYVSLIRSCYGLTPCRLPTHRLRTHLRLFNFPPSFTQIFTSVRMKTGFFTKVFAFIFSLVLFASATPILEGSSLSTNGTGEVSTASTQLDGAIDICLASQYQACISNFIFQDWACYPWEYPILGSIRFYGDMFCELYAYPECLGAPYTVFQATPDTSVINVLKSFSCHRND